MEDGTLGCEQIHTLLGDVREDKETDAGSNPDNGDNRFLLEYMNDLPLGKSCNGRGSQLGSLYRNYTYSE